MSEVLHSPAWATQRKMKEVTETTNKINYEGIATNLH